MNVHRALLVSFLLLPLGPGRASAQSISPETASVLRAFSSDADAIDADAPDNIPVHVRTEPRGTLLLTYGPYAHHTGRGPYNSRAKFTALEWERADHWSFGGATFRNSFAQPCEYAFVGRRFILKHHSGRFFAKLTGGVIHGYQPPHRSAVPLNWGGFNPALIPSLGYQYKGISVQLAVFGRAWGAVPMIGCALR